MSINSKADIKTVKFTNLSSYNLDHVKTLLGKTDRNEIYSFIYDIDVAFEAFTTITAYNLDLSCPLAEFFNMDTKLITCELRQAKNVSRIYID